MYLWAPTARVVLIQKIVGGIRTIERAGKLLEAKHLCTSIITDAPLNLDFS